MSALSIVDLLHTYLDAKLALTEANAGSDQKLGVIHKGTMYLVQFGKDGIAGMAVGPHSEAHEGAGVHAASAPHEAPAKKRGRPAKAETIAGPGSTPAAEAQPNVEAPKAEAPMSKDKFRAFAREIAARTSIEGVKAVIGCAIDALPADQYADRVVKLTALKEGKL